MTAALVALVRGYRWLSRARRPCCRYLPTCSDYAEQALREHGPWSGSWLTMRRLARCHPFGGWGYDPLPRR